MPVAAVNVSCGMNQASRCTVTTQEASYRHLVTIRATTGISCIFTASDVSAGLKLPETRS
jgi:uncharacterized protein YmfQ (DUF2313 family)